MKNKALENHENVCFKCLQKKDVKKYSMNRNNYGSMFDGKNTYLQLCEDCTSKDIENWFNEKPEMLDEYCADYKYENNILEFIDTLPIETQQIWDARSEEEKLLDEMYKIDIDNIKKNTIERIKERIVNLNELLRNLEK